MSSVADHGDSRTPTFPAWVIFRNDVQRDCWLEVGCTHAVDAGAAFRAVVLKPGQIFPPDRMGEYRVLPLDGSGHFAVNPPFSTQGVQMPDVPPADYAVYLTKTEIAGTLAALRAVIDSAPPGSPGQPMFDAERKLDEAMAR